MRVPPAEPRPAPVCSLEREPASLRFRSVFISDLHLGSRSCRVDALADFLRRVEAETIYLAGDIVDFWLLSHQFYWPAAHTEVVVELLRKAHGGTDVVYLPGNHDHALHALDGLSLGRLHFCSRTIHDAADGRRYLVIHGDQLDGTVRFSPVLALAGAIAYNGLVVLGRRVARLFGRPAPSFSVAGFAKRLCKRVCTALCDFHDQLSEWVGDLALDGVVFGHLHAGGSASLGDDRRSYNCGDWVESCTAIVETTTGEMRLLRWTDAPRECEA